MTLQQIKQNYFTERTKAATFYKFGTHDGQALSIFIRGCYLYAYVGTGIVRVNQKDLVAALELHTSITVFILHEHPSTIYIKNIEK